MLEQHVAVKGEGGHEVDPVERGLEEDRHGRRHQEAYEDLEGEPDVADELHVEEGVVRKRLVLVERPVGGVPAGVADGHVPDDGHPAVRVRLQAERQDGRQDEEDGEEGDALKAGKKEK